MNDLRVGKWIILSGHGNIGQNNCPQVDPFYFTQSKVCSDKNWEECQGNYYAHLVRTEDHVGSWQIFLLTWGKKRIEWSCWWVRTKTLAISICEWETSSLKRRHKNPIKILKLRTISHNCEQSSFDQNNLGFNNSWPACLHIIMSMCIWPPSPPTTDNRTLPPIFHSMTTWLGHWPIKHCPSDATHARLYFWQIQIACHWTWTWFYFSQQPPQTFEFCVYFWSLGSKFDALSMPTKRRGVAV